MIMYRGLLIIGLITGQCSGFIYQIHVLRRWSDELQAYQYVVGLSDFHDKSHPVNKSQRKYLEGLFCRYSRKKTKVIVEDLSSANNNGRIHCGRYTINSCGGVLGGLADVLRKMHCDVKNIEYRYCRVAALGPLINNIDARLDAFSSSNTLHIGVLWREIMKAIDDIRSYTDGKILNACYKRTISHVMRAMKRLHFDKNHSYSIAQYCARYANKYNRLDRLQTLCTFDSDLLDLKLVHSAIRSGDKSHIIAVAGGTHIKQACAMLQRVGFERVLISRISSIQEHNLSRCLGSHIVDNCFCVKPEPVDLTMLDRILSNQL